MRELSPAAVLAYQAAQALATADENPARCTAGLPAGRPCAACRRALEAVDAFVRHVVDLGIVDLCAVLAP